MLIYPNPHFSLVFEGMPIQKHELARRFNIFKEKKELVIMLEFYRKR